MDRDRRTPRALLLGSSCALLLAACAEEPPRVLERVYREPEPLATGREQKERLCSRGRSDAVLDVFCQQDVPEITSLLELRAELGVDMPGDKQEFAITGHSTSLVSRSVSAINPRVIFIRGPAQNEELLFMAFARGEQFSEIAVRDRVSDELQFYLVRFEQECNESACSPADLLTERAESGWRNVNVYAEEDLENTPHDCRTCHQTEGPDTPKLLRMQELEPPWNHWFYTFVPGGKAIIRDYLGVKEGETFAGLSSEDVALRSQPGVLRATLAFENPFPQPNTYDSDAIGREVIASAAERGGKQPEDNSVPGESATWNAIYERSKRGEAIAVPYHDVKVTDPDKLAAMSAAYTDYRAGELAPELLPDIRDVFPDDEMLLARMGFATEPGLDAEGVLLQACAQCHNDRLDQTLSRARFNVDLAKVGRDVRDRAIARLQLPLDDPQVMPPSGIRHLSDEAKQKLIELLRE
jgi:hypothetical protein